MTDDLKRYVVSCEAIILSTGQLDRINQDALDAIHQKFGVNNVEWRRLYLRKLEGEA